MVKLLRCTAFAALTVGVASTAAAGELAVTMANGRVTVIARDVPVRQILSEWARVGDTRIVNAEKLTGEPVTLQLVDVPEKEALDILLRSAAGYMTAPRPTGVAGASLYDRVIILATSRPPISNPNVPPTTPFGINRPAMNQPPPPVQPPPDDDDGDPSDQGPNGPQPGQLPPGMQPQPFPGAPPAGPAGPVPNQPVTSPRPGALPQPQPPGPNNPYAPPIGPAGRPVQLPPGRGGPGGVMPEGSDR